MKNYPISIFLILLLISIIVLSCFQNKSTEAEPDVENTSIAPGNEPYFEGNLSLASNGAFFEESITGVILPVDMSGLRFMIETEHPNISKANGEPVFVQLKGYLASKEIKDANEKPEVQLVISKILTSDEKKQEIDLMTGTFKGAAQNLIIAPDHTYELQYGNGNSETGSWHLSSKSTMILSNGKIKNIMRVNYKKKTLNSKDDNPVIYLLSSSNH